MESLLHTVQYQITAVIYLYATLMSALDDYTVRTSPARNKRSGSSQSKTDEVLVIVRANFHLASALFSSANAFYFLARQTTWKSHL